MEQNNLDTLLDTIRMFGKDKKYIVRFGASTILVTVLKDQPDYFLLGETWSNGAGTQVKTFNGFVCNS